VKSLLGFVAVPWLLSCAVASLPAAPPPGPPDPPLPPCAARPPEGAWSPSPPVHSAPTDHCLAPAEADHIGGDAYWHYVAETLGFAPEGDALAVVIYEPAFSPENMLSLHGRADGSYVLRLTRLNQKPWDLMMAELQRRQGRSQYLTDACEREALASIAVTKSVLERDLDPETAHGFLRMSEALVRRAQDTSSQGVWHGQRREGVHYYLWQGRRAGTVTAPVADGSVLEDGIHAMNGLRNFVLLDGPATPEDLAGVREQMQRALERTRHLEPCTKPFTRREPR
jgi:hypothetical protein